VDADQPMEPTARRAMLRTWDELWEAGTDSHLGLFREGALLGIMGIHRRIGPGGAEIGYWAHVDHTGRGYITEAAQAVTTACFRLDDVDRVEIHHDQANVASGAVPRRLGYTRVGEQPDEIVAPGEVGIKVIWRVAREEWVGE
jgi:RimJ/RimL family protein N-acetyltransferase